MDDLESVSRDIIAECGDDYVGLWSIIRKVRTVGIKDYPKLRTTTISLLKELLRRREILAGQFRNDLFEQWHGSHEEVLERIEREWIHLDREPTIGDIVWFVQPSN
jgi:hypothetical protein